MDLERLVVDIDCTLSDTRQAYFRALTPLFSPPGTDWKELMERYRYSTNVPEWQTPEAQAWIERFRNDPQAQEDLLVYPGAQEGIIELQTVIGLYAYLSARPGTVREATRRWIEKNKFPSKPLILKPEQCRENDSEWKARQLMQLYERNQVSGIIDDDRNLGEILIAKRYQGTVFVLEGIAPPHERIIPCRNWIEVVEKVKERYQR